MNEMQSQPEFIDLSYRELIELAQTNYRDAEEGKQVTQTSYKGESYYDRYPENDWRRAFYQEVLFRDKKTDGFVMNYPHGTIITQSERSFYYRGEKQVYSNSIPTLNRKLNEQATEEERAIYIMISDMRIAEFVTFLFQFLHVQKWQGRYGTVLVDALAQHYGLETHWLDITNDFNVALFFATCSYDFNIGSWRPLTAEETEVNDYTKYGVIFQASKMDIDLMNMTSLWEKTIHDTLMRNSVLPIGFQPFMRCHMQYGYGIYMENDFPLQQDTQFRKLRFRHSEKLSKEVFDSMEQGRKIYPHEGLMDFSDVLDELRKATRFSRKSFEYAFSRNGFFIDQEECMNKILKTELNGSCITITQDQHLYRVTRQRKRKMDKKYESFSLEKAYGIKLMSRLVSYPQPYS